MTQSKHLSPVQIRGIDKLGDSMLPGDSDFPRFSESHCVAQVDRILDHMPVSDLGDLKTLLGILGALPGWFAAFLIWVLERGAGMPGPIGAQIRFIRLGIRGLIMSLYYGDEKVLQTIGYQVSVYTADLR